MKSELNNEQQIDKIIEDIFAYKVNIIMPNIVDFLEKLNATFQNLEKENQIVFKEIIQYLHMGLSNKDYLMVADILNYELKPFFKKI